MPLVGGKYVPPGGGGKVNQQAVTQAAQKPQQTQTSALLKPAPLPYLAERIDAFGRPYYGDGFQGWAKKTWATLFAPTNFEYLKTEASKQAYQQGVTKTQKTLEAANWQSWGEKVTGISAKQIGEGLAGIEAGQAQAKEQGESVTGKKLEQSTGLATRVVPAIWDTVVRVVSTTDFLARKVYAFQSGLADAKNSAYTLKEEEIANPTVKSIVNIANAVSPTAMWANAASVATAIVTGKITFGEVEKIVSNKMAGSGMLYTSLTNETVKNEFLSRLHAGEDPDILAEELQNPWAELVGSVLGDPLTWEGAGIIGEFGKAKTFLKVPLLGKDIVVGGKTLSVPWRTVGHLPTFGDALSLVGIKIGKARLLNETEKFTTSVLSEFGPEIRAAANNIDAQKAVVTAVTKASKKILDYTKEYGIVSFEASAKAARVGRDATHILYNLVAYSGDTEGAYQALSAYSKVKRGATEAEKALGAATLMSHPLGDMLTSEKGLQTLDLIDRLDGQQIQNIIDAAQGDRLKLGESLFKHVDAVLHEMFASVDEIEDAATKVAKGAKDFTPAEARLFERYQKEKYTLPFLVRKVTRKVDKVNAPIVGTMANVYIRWNPGFYSKNIQGQALRIVMDMGLEAGVEISAKAAGAVLKPWAERMLAEHQQASMDLLGYIHESTNRGFGKALNMVADSAANRAEGLTSGEIAVRTLREEIQKGMRSGAIPQAELDALDRLVPGVADEMLSALFRFDGNRDKALAFVRANHASGFIKAEQMVELPPAARKFLADNHLLDTVLDIQRNDPGLTRDEVLAKLKSLTPQMRAKLEDALNKVPATLGQGPVKQMPELAEAALEAQALHAEGTLPFETADGFTKMTQSWDDAQDAMNKLVSDALSRIGPSLDEATRVELIDEINAASHARESLRNIASVRNPIRQLSYEANRAGSVVSDLWKRAVVGDMYDLGKQFPNIDPATISRQEFKQLLWQYFYDWSGKDFHVANTTQFSAKMKALEKAAGKVKLDLKALFAPVDGQSSLFDNAMRAMEDAEKYQQEYFSREMRLSTALAGVPKGTTLQDAVLPKNIDKQEVFDAVNVARAAKGEVPAGSLSDITKEEWSKSLKKPKKTPPPYNGEQPSIAMATYKNIDGFEAEFNSFIDGVGNAWGQTIPTSNFTPEAEKALSDFSMEYERRMTVVRTKASAAATAKRDFLLHSYDKTYLDHAFAYLSPFHYWTDRTYVRAIEQLVDNPGFIAAGAKYKDFIEKEHAGLPDWWKYNVQVPNLFGADPDTPLYMNLQAGLDPLNGLVGIDFNDPYKRVDWISSTVDNLNKFGPTLTTPIQWAVGLHLYNKGEVDAGQRWFGRLLPQSALVKAGLTLAQNKLGKGMLNAGPFAQNNEVDPFVNFLDGGLDPYERARVGRALAAMQNEGIPEEALLDAARTQKGEIWDAAVQKALTWRAPGQLMSGVLGVSAKPRTEQDMQTDQMYGELHHLYALSSTLSPEDYKQGFEDLNKKYPFMDVVLLSKKAGPERDSSYAYNVLSRIPPGDSSKILASMGIPYSDVNKFYDSKGFTDETVMWTDTEKQRFMSAIVDLGAMLKLPDTATKEEWQSASAANKRVIAEIQAQLGDDVFDKLSEYYAIKEDDPIAAEQYAKLNPEIFEAQRAKWAAVSETPILAAYYGGIDTIEKYVEGEVYARLTKKYGSNIFALWNEYYERKMRDEADGSGHSKYFFSQNADKFIGYSKDKKAWMAGADQKFMSLGARLPSGTGAQLRPDFQAQSGFQQGLLEAVGQPTNKQAPSARELAAIMKPGLWKLVLDYWTTGRPLSDRAMSQLDYVASKNGYGSGSDLLRMSGVTVAR